MHVCVYEEGTADLCVEPFHAVCSSYQISTEDRLQFVFGGCLFYLSVTFTASVGAGLLDKLFNSDWLMKFLTSPECKTESRAGIRAEL